MSAYANLSAGALSATYTATPGVMTGLDNTKAPGSVMYKLAVTTAAWWAQGIADTPIIGLASNDTFTSAAAHNLTTGMPVQAIALGDTAISQAWRVTATGPVFVDETTDANSAGANDVQPFPSGEVANDYFAVGYTNNFSTLKVVLGTSGTVGTLTWEYWNGSAWAALAGVTDNTTQLKAAPGTYTVTFTIPADWAPLVLNGSASLYYVRAKVTGAYTVDPLITQLFVSGTLPTGLSASTTYWAIVTGSTTFKLASSRANALAGTPIDITTQSGGTYMSTVAVAGGPGSALLPVGVIADIDGVFGTTISVVQDASNGKASLVPVAPVR